MKVRYDASKDVLTVIFRDGAFRELDRPRQAHGRIGRDESGREE